MVFWAAAVFWRKTFDITPAARRSGKKKSGGDQRHHRSCNQVDKKKPLHLLPPGQQFGLDHFTDRDDLVVDRKERIADFVNVFQIDQKRSVHPHHLRRAGQHFVKTFQRLGHEQFPLPGDDFAVIVVCFHPQHVVQEQAHRPVLYFDEQSVPEQTGFVLGYMSMDNGCSLCKQYVGAIHVAKLGW